MQLAGGRDGCASQRTEVVLCSNLATASFLSCMASGKWRATAGRGFGGRVLQHFCLRRDWPAERAPLANAKHNVDRFLIFAGETPTGRSVPSLTGRLVSAATLATRPKYLHPLPRTMDTSGVLSDTNRLFRCRRLRPLIGGRLQPCANEAVGRMLRAISVS